MSIQQSSVSAVPMMPTAAALTPADIAAQFGEASYTETRKVSSVIVESTVIGEMPKQDTVRYIEVPTIEEQVKYVTVKEFREVEKRVPKYEYEWVEKIVEKPVIVEKRREVEVPQYVDRVVEKRVKQVVERPVEILKEIRVPKTVTKEVVIEVPGDVIEVPKPYTVEVPVDVPHPVDKKVAVIVSQTVKPVIVEGGDSMVVDVLDYEPEVIPVDVHIAKPVASALKFVGQTDAKHRVVNVTAAQYNAILRQLNIYMDEKMKVHLPYVSENNTIPFASDVHYIVAPENVWHEESKIVEVPRVVREIEETSFVGSRLVEEKKSRQCCNPGTKAKGAKVVQPVVTSTPEGTVSQHSARSGTQARELPYYKAGEPSLSATNPPPQTVSMPAAQTVEVIPKDGASSTTTSCSTSKTSTVITQLRNETGSQVSLVPQTRQRVCC